MGVAAGPDVRRRSRGEPAAIPYVRGRERNTRWVAFGLVLTLLGGLGAFVVAASLADRVDVVVAARPLDAGRPLAREDLKVVGIAGGDGARAIAAGQLESLVGSVPTSDLPAGAILHPDQIVAAEDSAERTVIVGAALAPGQYPLTDLSAGQEVQVIEVSGETGFSEDDDGSAVLGRGTVVSAKVLAGDEMLVSLRVAEGMAPLMSERSQQRRIRLVLVEGAGTGMRPAVNTTTTTLARDRTPPGLAPSSGGEPITPTTVGAP